MEKPPFSEIDIEDEEAPSPRFHLSQNVRTTLAILIVIISAMVVWWIMS